MVRRRHIAAPYEKIAAGKIADGDGHKVLTTLVGNLVDAVMLALEPTRVGEVFNIREIVL